MKSILMKLFIMGLCVSFFPIQAIAEDLGGFTGKHEIEWVNQRECTENRGFEVRLTEKHANPDGCSNEFVLEVPCRYKPYRTLVAILLEAFSDGNPIEAYVQDCDGEGQALVRSVRMLEPEEPPEETEEQ